MADLEKAKTEPKEQLLDQLEESHGVMLGVRGSSSHMQPMSPEVDRETGSIWFFTRKSSDLVREVGGGADSRICLVAKGGDYHACIDGRMSENKRQDVIERHWNAVIAAWYEKGKEDPDLTLLEFRPSDAAIWASTGSSLAFGWEIAKANITGSEPDVGVRTEVHF